MPRLSHPSMESKQLRRFECTVCGAVNYAPKRNGKTNDGHIKTFYCYRCQKKRGQVQRD